MKVNEFVDWAKIVNESGGDLDTQTQSKLLLVADGLLTMVKRFADEKNYNIHKCTDGPLINGKYYEYEYCIFDYLDAQEALNMEV